MVFKSSLNQGGGGGGGGSGTVTQINTGTGLTGGPITTTGTVSIANNTANTLAGFDNSGVFADVTVSTGLSLSGGVLTATGGGGAVSSVSNSDGTLTISPTTGAVIASLALGHANTWTGQQTFSTSSPIFSTMTVGSILFAGTSGLLSQDNANWFYDPTNHRAALGGNDTTTIAAKFRINPIASEKGLVVKLATSAAQNAIEVQPVGSSTPTFQVDQNGYLNILNTVAACPLTTGTQVSGGTTTPILDINNFGARRFALDAFGQVYLGDNSGAFPAIFGLSPAALTFPATANGDKIYLYPNSTTTGWGFGIKPFIFTMFMDPSAPGIGKFSWRHRNSNGTEVMNLYTTGALQQIMQNDYVAQTIQLVSGVTKDALQITTSALTVLGGWTKDAYIYAGAATNASGSTIHSGGSLAANIITKTTTYPITATDFTILCDATSAGFTTTLPTAVGITGRIYNIKKIDSTANAVTLATTSSQTIDGVTTKSLTVQYTSYQVQSDGANWQVL